MSRAEIIVALAHLSREDLADVPAWLDRFAPERAATATPAARIRTPRLADPARAGDFKKQVTELPADAAV